MGHNHRKAVRGLSCGLGVGDRCVTRAARSSRSRIAGDFNFGEPEPKSVGRNF
jgi:hypothetical protein